MMPLTVMKSGEESVIKKVGGKEETRKFLEALGFVKGSTVQMITSMNGNVIVNIVPAVLVPAILKNRKKLVLCLENNTKSAFLYGKKNHGMIK